RGDPGDLAELLRKCHRAELEPLARLCRIKAFQLPLDRLAAAIDRTVRRAGDNEVRNVLFRGGDGPPWPEVLRRFGARHGIRLPADPAEAELAVVRWWVDRFWPRIDAPTQRRILALMELDQPAPVDPEEALDRVHHASEYLVTRPGLELLPLGLLPGGGCLILWRLGRPRDDLLVPAVLEIARLRQSVRHRVTVGIVGSPSSGKDAAIAAIFGMDTGNVNPVAGSTTDVEITRLPGATALFVVNTPGMGDVIASVTERAREVLDLIDVYVYVVNAQGGVQAREKADYARCVATGRPVLAVVNKIDTIKPEDRARYLADARAKLGAPERDFLAVAFDPLPVLADAPIGVDAVRAWLSERLVELGKDPGELPWATDPGDDSR
ncbi:MAG: hypothetical protein D6798_17955, partial [Deltaproteobacteria bacterium]